MGPILGWFVSGPMLTVCARCAKTEDEAKQRTGGGEWADARPFYDSDRNASIHIEADCHVCGKRILTASP